MSTDYEAPAVTELGDFTEETGIGIGNKLEPWWPLADRDA